jgi:hypothetical protein
MLRYLTPFGTEARVTQDSDIYEYSWFMTFKRNGK